MNLAIQRTRSNVAINIVVVFLILAILRLLPFNYYASLLIGHDVVVDNKEGNAINFINYISTGLLVFIGLIKLPRLEARWSELWPFAGLAIIYLANLFLAPYVNISWVLYQLVFIAIAALLHLLISGDLHRYEGIINSKFFLFFIIIWVLFLAFVCVQLYAYYPISYIIEEFNDSFVNGLNTFGVMKQYYGYSAGFIALYAIFILKNYWLRIGIIVLVCLTAFGIRSFLIGFTGVIIIHYLGSPMRLLILRLLLIFFLVGLFTFFYRDRLMMDLLFDTRFYAYMNAWDIIHTFPFGVGLGGYPEYTEINNRDLFAAFYNIDAALNYVPNSPESDLVHVFGSLGFGLGICHFILQFRLIVLGLTERMSMSSFEKFMFFYFVYMTFFGISEDTMFTVSYWIFFGIASGTIATVRKRSRNV